MRPILALQYVTIMKNLLFFAFLIGSLSLGFAQTETTIIGPRPYRHLNSVQLELLGSGGAYSINYERILLNGHIFQTGIRSGVGITGSPFGLWEAPETRIPILVSEQVSYGRHHLEVAGGITLMNSYNFWILKHASYGNKLFPMGALSGGYRYQKPEGRLIFRVAYTPFFRLKKIDWSATMGDPKLIHSFGATVGYAF